MFIFESCSQPRRKYSQAGQEPRDATEGLPLSCKERSSVEAGDTE